MPIITLPDGTTRSYDTTTSPLQVAEDISAGLASVAIGARVDGELVDLSTPIDSDVELKIVTARKGEKETDPDAFLLIRHSLRPCHGRSNTKSSTKYRIGVWACIRERVLL